VAKARDLVGRTITAVDFRKFQRGPNRGWATDPVLTLDNGKQVHFVVQETEVGEYGIEVCVSGAAQRKTRPGKANKPFLVVSAPH
jgi:hypothetical protein